MGICGKNGAGKTTLLKLIVGQLAPTEGTVKTGQLTKFNYVDQGRLQLDDERTVLDEAADGTEWVQWGQGKISLRSYLKRFLFADERITTQVKHLSGGERSRLLLARILKCGGNFLILDEPTNDLDLPTLRVLEEALIAFPGVVCVVSHDRYFLNRVCTDILAFEDGVNPAQRWRLRLLPGEKATRRGASRALDDGRDADKSGGDFIRPRRNRAQAGQTGQTFLQANARIGRHRAADSGPGRGDCAH